MKYLVVGSINTELVIKRKEGKQAPCIMFNIKIDAEELTCIALGDTAEQMLKQASKGSLVLLTGTLVFDKGKGKKLMISKCDVLKEKKENLADGTIYVYTGRITNKQLIKKGSEESISLSISNMENNAITLNCIASSQETVNKILKKENNSFIGIIGKYKENKSNSIPLYYFDIDSCY